jgi:tripartite-type tricarboxylate transporter receptor subunit TctC
MACSLLTAAGASAQPAPAWPARPVTLVIPYGLGGAGDTVGRLIAQKLTAEFGQNFITVNKTGAGGLVAANDVARAQPDGYTLFISSMGELILANAIDQNSSLNPVKDFTHIAFFGGSPAVIFSNPALLPAKNLKELVAYSKANPGKPDFGLAAYGSSGHLVSTLLQREAHITFNYVPYRGGNDTLTSVLGGHIPIAAFTISTAGKQIENGRVRGLAVSSAHRMPLFPNVPTFAEQGFPDIVLSGWYGLSGPAHMPPDIVKKLNAAVVKAMEQPELREAYKNLTLEQPPPYDAAAFTAFVARETARWTPIAQSIHVQQ